MSSVTSTDSPRLKITGIKEQIKWHKQNATSGIGWFTGIGIEGLIPALAPGGYAHNYTIELISPSGNSLSKSHLSQAPDGFGTSTTVKIGGMGLPSGKYIIKVSGGNQEDTFTIDVPDISVPLPEIDMPAPKTRIIKKILSPQNEALKFVKEIHLEEVGDCTYLTIRRNDDTEYSAILQDPSIIGLSISKSVINKIAVLMSNTSILKFADNYIKEDRKEISFFNELITLASSISSLDKYPETNDLLRIGDITELLHNRVVAQLLDHYNQFGCTINSRPGRRKNGRRNDFDIQSLKCEVKTIQPIGEVVVRDLGGVRFTERFQKRLINAIADDLESAYEQVQGDGMIFIAPWSYKVNGILRQYFRDGLVIFPPPPESELTVLVLEGRRVFESLYVSLASKHALSTLISAISIIQANGVSEWSFAMIKEGLPIRATTAPRTNSSVGYSFKIWETDP